MLTEMNVVMQHRELPEKIIGCAFRVYKQLGFGFAESVCERAMLIELRRIGLQFEAQKPITVSYLGEVVGEFIADILVEETIIVELKAIRAIAPAHEVQLVNYLTATGKPVGLLLNFGETGVEICRKVRTLKRPSEGVPHPVNPVNPVENSDEARR
jgi:GxxExxY protein